MLVRPLLPRRAVPTTFITLPAAARNTCRRPFRSVREERIRRPSTSESGCLVLCLSIPDSSVVFMSRCYCDVVLYCIVVCPDEMHLDP
jgi:hypothetical protein